MSRKVLRLISVACGGLVVSALLFPGVSMAQSDFPSSAGFRAGLGTHGVFDVSGGQSHSIAELKDGDLYRVCIVGNSGRLVVDGRETVMDNGDCHDAFGKSFSFSADQGGETNGFYTHPRRHRRR